MFFFTLWLIKLVKLSHDSCRFIDSVILSSHFVSFRLDLNAHSTDHNVLFVVLLFVVLVISCFGFDS